MAIQGDSLVIGSDAEEPSPNGGPVGAAYIFTRQGTNWIQKARLQPNMELSELAGNITRVGSSVGIFGSTLVIGNSGDDLLGGNAGAAHVFVRQGEGWFETDRLSAEHPAPETWFGTGDIPMGERVAIVSTTGPFTTPSGGVPHVFTYGANGWSLRATLAPQDPPEDVEFFFEAATALSGDTVLVGSPWGKGNVYVFKATDVHWDTVDESVIISPATNVTFGKDVALTGDTALIGAPDSHGGFEGRAFIYVYNGTNWTLQSTLLPPQPNTEREFGEAVALQGSRAIVYGSTAALHIYTRFGTNWVFDYSVLAEPDAKFQTPALLLSDNFAFVRARTSTEFTVNIYSLPQRPKLAITINATSVRLDIASTLGDRLAVEVATSLSGDWTQLMEIEANTNPYPLTVPIDSAEPARFFRVKQLNL